MGMKTGINCSALSNDELVKALEPYRQEAFKRNLVGYKLSVGQYTVGVHIPVGTYRVNLISGNDRDWYLKVYASMNTTSASSTKKRRGRETLFEATLSYLVPEISCLMLNSGETLSIIPSIITPTGYFVFSEFAGLEIVDLSTVNGTVDVNEGIDS